MLKKKDIKEGLYIVTGMRRRCKVMAVGNTTMELMYQSGIVKTTPLTPTILDYCEISYNQNDNYIQAEPFKK